MDPVEVDVTVTCQAAVDVIPICDSSPPRSRVLGERMEGQTVGSNREDLGALVSARCSRMHLGLTDGNPQCLLECRLLVAGRFYVSVRRFAAEPAIGTQPGKEAV